MNGLLTILAAAAMTTAQPSGNLADDNNMTSPVQSVADDFEGSYRYVGGASEKRALERAIDDVVQDMSVFVQGIARKRLSEGNPVPHEIHLKHAGDEMVVFIAGKQYRAPLDGGEIETLGLTGEPVRYRLRIAPQRKALEQAFIADEGRRVDRFERTEDGVVLDVEVSSEKLPKPLTYRLSYARAE